MVRLELSDSVPEESVMGNILQGKTIWGDVWREGTDALAGAVKYKNKTARLAFANRAVLSYF